MLLKDFYTVNSIETTENKTVAQIVINKDHDVFRGHFPGNPVTPGVCMMQIIKELTEGVVGESLLMKSSSNVKFMAIINPEVNPNLEVALDISHTDAGFKVKNVTKFDDTIALKLTTNFQKK